MPNHVINKICMQGDPKEIQSMLEKIKNDEFGIGTVDSIRSSPCPKASISRKALERRTA